MKKLIRIAIIIGVIYFAYTYYKKNYTIEGKKKTLLEEEAIRESYEARGVELRAQFITQGYSQCELTYPYHSTFQMNLAWTCKLMIEDEASTIDWVNEAMNE